MKNTFSKRSLFLSRKHLFWTLKTGLSQFGAIFPVHRDLIAAHGGKKLTDFSVKSCGEIQRYDHQIAQKLSTCRQTDRFLAVFYNSSLVRNFERPLEDHCGNNSHISECRLNTFLDTFLIRKAPKTGVMTNIEGFVSKESSKVFGNGSEEFLFVLGTHANPLALRRQLNMHIFTEFTRSGYSMWNTLLLTEK